MRGNEVEVAHLMKSEAYCIYKKVICSDSLLMDFINLTALINISNIESMTTLINELKKGNLKCMRSLALNFLELTRIILVHTSNSALVKQSFSKLDSIKAKLHNQMQDQRMSNLVLLKSYFDLIEKMELIKVLNKFINKT